MKDWMIHTKQRIYPFDNAQYSLDLKVIDDTCNVLEEYKNIEPSHEGLVYWAGIRNGDKAIIKMVVAPSAESAEQRITTTHKSNAQYVKLLAKHGYVHIAQVHSHPGAFIDHSPGDDEWTPFKRNGLISIVVASYGKYGMLPMNICGVHKFIDQEFVRLNEEYIDERFHLSKEMNTLFEDLRDEKK